MLRVADATKRAYFWKKNGVSFDPELKQSAFLSSLLVLFGESRRGSSVQGLAARGLQPLEQRPRPDIVGITRRSEGSREDREQGYR